MAYRLGIDLGSVNTTAALSIDGAPPQLLSLGSAGPELASVVFVQEDGTLVVGPEAERLGEAEPTRLAREFKPRTGDGVPVPVAGQAFPRETLTSALLRHVVGAATEQQGSAADEIVLTHPAGWTDYRLELFGTAVAGAEVGPVTLRTEAAAAATFSASEHPLELGARVVVYDLGATFNLCVLERTASGFAVLGTPGGTDAAGGTAFDEAVFRLVRGAIGDRLRELDPADPDLINGLAWLRRDCVRAKEALASEPETTVRVELPGFATTVRLSRSELMSLIRPALREAAAITVQTLESASLSASDLTAVVLLGGSSRIPAVAELLHRELGVPIAPDVHPIYDTALGSLLVGEPVVSEGTAMPVALVPELVPLTGPEPTAGPDPAPAPVSPDPVVVPTPAPVVVTASAGKPRPQAVRPPAPPLPGSAPTAPTAVGATLLAPAEAMPHRANASWSPVSPGQGSGQAPQGPIVATSGYQGGPPVGPGSPAPRPPGGPGRPGGAGGPGRPGGLPPTPGGPGGPGDTPDGRRRVVLIAVVGVLALALLAGIGILVARAIRGPDTAVGPGTTVTSVPVPPGTGPSATGLPTSDPSSSGSSTPGQTSSANPTATGTGSAAPSPGSSLTPGPVPTSQALPTSAPLPAGIVVASMRLEDGERDLFLVDVSKRAKAVPLPSLDGNDSTPAMLSQRTTIIYTNDGEVRVMAADGTGDRPLFEEAPKGCEQVRDVIWNTTDPEQLILQCRSDDDEEDSIQIVKLNGEVVRRLRISKDHIEDPSLSRDGQLIAYWASDDRKLDGGSIYTIPIDGSEQPTQLTDERAGTDADPAWSPDGSQIAFRHKVADGTKKGNHDVYVMNFDGSDPQPVAETPAEDGKPSWSADGTQLLVISNRETAVGGPGDYFDLWLTRTEDGRVLRSCGVKADYVTTSFWTYR